MNFKNTIALMAPLALLAACGEEVAPEAAAPANGGEVAGDVLGGTISDDMLPLDELTSVSPPAEPVVEPDGSGGNSTSQPDATVAASPEEETPETQTQEAEAPSDAPAPETTEE